MTKTVRIAAIDVFRALTMLLMILVNDLPWVSEVPHWLEHALPGEDMLGLADVVFPAFLFIVGMSVPFATENRLRKDPSIVKVYGHVLLRSLSLLVIGVLIANRRTLNGEWSPFTIDQYTLLIMAGIFLIWNLYPVEKKRMSLVFRLVGIGLLAWVASQFSSGDYGQSWLRPHWGILGTIGWSYLISSIFYLAVYKKQTLMVAVFFLFITVNLMMAGGAVGFPQQALRILFSTSTVFTMAGVVTGLLVRKYAGAKDFPRLAAGLLPAGILLLTAGFLSHRWWIISKVHGTPTWMFLCLGISVLFYLALHWLVQIRGKEGWFRVIRPAGVATLTCYMLPYIYYSIRGWSDIWLGEALTTGAVGILKSVVFAFLIIGATALLGRVGIRLKL